MWPDDSQPLAFVRGPSTETYLALGISFLLKFRTTNLSFRHPITPL